MSSFMLQGSFNARSLSAESGEPWIFRSATLDTASQGDIHSLAGYGVNHVIDLRSRLERGPVAHPFEVSVLPLYGEEKLPPQGGSIEGVYRGLVDRAGHGIAEAAAVVARNPGVTLVHCRIGKDRTGLVIALIALAAGVAESEVLADYALSQVEVRKHTAGQVYRQLRDLNLDQSEMERARELHLDSPPEAMENTLDWLHTQFRGVEEYLVHHGLQESDLDKLREKHRGQSPTALPARGREFQQ
ncbi:tyrosine-protein phosphatase [uncultured Agrococcus sp.]|uniref:tyrosine-protein phosphatase n=1 Tax=uncultured Agrococcus sp. TaxID=382258 RepID=UPI0025F8AE49|nr:tyrosine-protein phosphatase [uncultured Agrococcus sp.]